MQANELTNRLMRMLSEQGADWKLVLSQVLTVISQEPAPKSSAVVTPIAPPEAWMIGGQIGKGAYGSVHSLVDPETGTETDELRKWCAKQVLGSNPDALRLSTREVFYIFCVCYRIPLRLLIFLS
jgi:hypothetical protein